MTKMTAYQKDQIINLRKAGSSYSEIAWTLSLTKDQVSGYCRRNSISTTTTSVSNENRPTGHFCPNCGKEISQPDKMKTIRFCSATCRVSWWNSHPEMVQKKAYYNFICAHCGSEGRAYGNASRKYCSHACYIADRFGGRIG